MEHTAYLAVNTLALLAPPRSGHMYGVGVKRRGPVGFVVAFVSFVFSGLACPYNVALLDPLRSVQFSSVQFSSIFIFKVQFSC